MGSSEGKINNILRKNDYVHGKLEEKISQSEKSLVRRAELQKNSVLTKIKEHEEISRYKNRAKVLLMANDNDIELITYIIATNSKELLDEGYDDAILLAYAKALSEITDEETPKTIN